MAASEATTKVVPLKKAILRSGFQEAGQVVVMLRIHGVMEGSVLLFLR